MYFPLVVRDLQNCKVHSATSCIWKQEGKYYWGLKTNLVYIFIERAPILFFQPSVICFCFTIITSRRLCFLPESCSFYWLVDQSLLTCLVLYYLVLCVNVSESLYYSKWHFVLMSIIMATSTKRKRTYCVHNWTETNCFTKIGQRWVSC